VARPEQELKRCPVCARDVCGECCSLEPKIEAHLCLECAARRRAAGDAGTRSKLHLLKLGASIAGVGVGSLMALTVVWTPVLLAGVALVLVGIVTFAWQLVCRHVCPLCEGKAKVRRRAGQSIEYGCRICGHVWVE